MAPNYIDSGNEKPPTVGSYQVVNIVRYVRELPYGMAGKIPIIIDKFKGNRIDPQLVKVQTGDRVKVRIHNYLNGCAFANVIENHGSFIDIGDECVVELTQQSKSDARDSISVPSGNGGLYGTFAVVKRMDPINPEDVAKPRKCRVRVSQVFKGHNKRYCVITNSTDQSLERPIKREIYIKKWPFPQDDRRLETEFRYNMDRPDLSAIANCRMGVPREDCGMLYFGPKESKKVVSLGGKFDDFSEMTPIEAIRQFYRRFGDEKFRLALSTGENFGSIVNAIEQSGLDLIAQFLTA